MLKEMLSKEVLTLIVLVVVFLVLVSWTSTEKEAFSDQKYILQSYSELKKKWAQEYKDKRESQDNQENRLEQIEKMINTLENKMERIKDNFIINPSLETKVDRSYSVDDPYGLMDKKHVQKFSNDHYADRLS